MLKSISLLGIILIFTSFAPHKTRAANVTHLDFEASTDGIAWSRRVTALSGRDTVQIRVSATFSGEDSVRPIGLASVNFQPTIGNWAQGQDSLLSFASFGTNSSGGSVPDMQGLNVPYGRIRPFANTGPGVSDPYIGREQYVDGVSYLRIARSSIDNWPSDGPTTGATAPNNSNGSGGIAVSQRSFGNVTGTDPIFMDQLEHVVVFKFAIRLGSSGTLPRTLAVGTPIQSVSRNWQTGEREALWYANYTDNFGQVRSSVEIGGAEIVVIPSFGTHGLIGMAVVGCAGGWARRRGGVLTHGRRV